MSRRVVVTGIGVVSALGVGCQEHWAALVSGRSAVGRVERLTAAGFPVDVAAEVPAAAVASYLPRLPRKQLKLYNRATTFAMAAAALAAEEAGLPARVADAERSGVVLATLFIPYPIRELLRLLPDMESREERGSVDTQRGLAVAMSGLNPLDLSLKLVPNLTAGHIAIQYGLKGFCRTVSDGCTGGMHAIAQAASLIRGGELDLAFCGGAEASLEDLVFADLCATGCLATPVAPAERTCRPFGAGRAGTVAGEGAAVLILESLDHARARGAAARGEVLGFGGAIGPPTPDGLRGSMERAMAEALAESGLAGVDMVSTNGDAGRLSDQAEAESLRAMFPAALPELYATKAAHGHLFSAAAPLEVAGALLALRESVVPPSRNGEDADPACGVTLSPASRPRAGLSTALVNAMGAYGEAASLVLARGGDRHSH
ncbi:MAG TPA: beta-ketoacyl synthase N-terminal-like domain-containing protein [Candidatus Sulfotelmatobacter sp.]|nr:beta-ketoacyl synthase N-terminal-like domain-containing protein [Candidatus Sulfotelmatobacter sp.]